jgi:hypothetical protein
MQDSVCSGFQDPFPVRREDLDRQVGRTLVSGQKLLIVISEDDCGIFGTPGGVPEGY